MSKQYIEDYIEVNIHEFKTHLSRHIRLMEAGVYKKVVIKRRNVPLGAFILFDREKHGEVLDNMRL